MIVSHFENRAEPHGLRLISKVKVAQMAVFAICDSFALGIELQCGAARLCGVKTSLG
jgi:hypothetical protein